MDTNDADKSRDIVTRRKTPLSYSFNGILFTNELLRDLTEATIDMSGPLTPNKLRKGTSPGRRSRDAEAISATHHKMALHELRQAREKSQVELARDMRVGQSAVAKMEQRTDMHISNLRRYVEALGGKLEITARFLNESVTITNFAELSGYSEQPGQGDNASSPASS